MKRSQKLLFSLFSVVVGLLVGLAAAEVVLRIYGFSSPDFFQADETLGYIYTPGIEGRYTKEGESYVRINSEGFRDAEHSIEKPADVFRVAVVGDSYVAGFEVEAHERFTAHLEKTLGTCAPLGGRRVEMLSFGAAGYGTAQQLLLVRDRVLRYSPDLLILLFTTNNDVIDNSRAFRDGLIPFFVLKDGELTLDDSFARDPKFRFNRSAVKRGWAGIYNSLRVFQAIAAGWRALKSRTPPPARQEGGNAAPAKEQVIAEPGTENEVYRPPTSPAWQDAWAVTEAMMIAMRDDVAAAGSRLMIVTGSNGIQVLPDVRAREAFARALGVADLYYPDRRVAEFGRMNSIPVVTLAPLLADHAEREQVILHGFADNPGNGHWNQLGHRLVGELIAEPVCTEFGAR